MGGGLDFEKFREKNIKKVIKNEIGKGWRDLMGIEIWRERESRGRIERLMLCELIPNKLLILS